MRYTPQHLYLYGKPKEEEYPDPTKNVKPTYYPRDPDANNIGDLVKGEEEDY